MKKLLIVIPVLFLLFGFTLSRTINQKMQDILNQIQYSDESAKNMIFDNCNGPSFYYPNPMKLKALASKDKAAMVSLIGDYVKSYVNSDEFLQRYKEFKEQQKPTPPEKPQTAKEMKEAQKASIKEGIENLKKTKASMPKDQQASFDETIKSFQDQLKDLDDPNNSPYNADFDKMMQQGYEQQMDDYNAKVAEWNKQYPDNPTPMVKKWLQAFLDASKDVDYNAKLIDGEDGKKLFASTAYERKPYEWKLFYRVGKETVDAGRKYAEAWLKKLK
jgi:flagellar biosynthesis GTPase FlhF